MYACVPRETCMYLSVPTLPLWSLDLRSNNGRLGTHMIPSGTVLSFKYQKIYMYALDVSPIGLENLYKTLANKCSNSFMKYDA